jgi:hypothetical protein
MIFRRCRDGISFDCSFLLGVVVPHRRPAGRFKSPAGDAYPRYIRHRLHYDIRVKHFVISTLRTSFMEPISAAARSKAWAFLFLAYWDCGFESRLGYGCLSRVTVVCCQVEVSVTGRLLA